MNHVFRTIWSKTLGTWVVASELAAGHGKGGGGNRPRRPHAVERLPAGMHGHWALRLVALAALLALYTPAQAAVRYWDANSNATGMGGAGSWDLTTKTWDDGTVHDGVAGPYLSGWNNAALDSAVFMGTAGMVTLDAPITVNALSFNTGGYTLTGGSLTLAGTTPSISVIGTASISSAIAGSAGLVKAGAGTLTLSGANSFTGGVNVNEGTLALNGASTFTGDISLGSGAGLTVANDAALGAATNRILTSAGSQLTLDNALAASRTVSLGAGGQTTVTGAGAGATRYTGAGGVTAFRTSLTNNANDYTGQTIVQVSVNDRVTFSSVGNLGQASALGAASDPTQGAIVVQRLNGATGYFSYIGTGSDSNRNWQLPLTGGNLAFENNGSGALTLRGDIAVNGSAGVGVGFLAGSGDVSLLGQISGTTGAVNFSGGSTGRTVTLGGSNTFNAATTLTSVTVNAGVLADAGATSSFGVGTRLTFNNGVLRYTGGGASSNRDWTVSGGTNGTIANDGTGALSLSGAATLNANSTLTLGGAYAGGANTYSGVISGAGNLASTSAGTWVLTGANTRTGGITVDGGTLRAGSASAFGVTSTVAVNGGVLDLNNFNLTASSLAGTGGTVALGSGTLAVNPVSGNTTFGGSITGSGGLVKLGVGTQTLTGANTYTGATTIGGGTLALDFSNAGAPPSNIISGASTLNMQGGTLRVTGGAGSTSAQAFNGLNVLSSNNTLNVAPGTGGSVLVDLGAISYAGGLLNFSSAGTFGSTGTARIATTRADGKLGGWATINGTDYAKVLGGYIVPFTSSDYTYKDNAADWVDSDILSDGGDTGTIATAYYGAVSGNKQIGGLQYVATQNSTVTVGGGNTLGVDGTIVVSSSVGAATQRITGGALTGIAGGGALGILKNGTGAFTVESTIVDNGGATGLAKSGTGTVVLSGANSYTGATTVSQGTLSVSSIANGGAASNIGASSADASNLLLQGGNLSYAGASNTTDRGFTLATNGSVTGGTIEVTNAGANLRFDGQVVSPDGANLIAKGPGTLTLGNTANTYSGTTTIDSGTLAVTELANGGSVSSIGTSSSAPSSLVMTNGGTLAYLGGTDSSDRGFLLNSSGGINVTNARPR